jgi:hypothetical protein
MSRQMSPSKGSRPFRDLLNSDLDCICNYMISFHCARKTLFTLLCSNFWKDSKGLVGIFSGSCLHLVTQS